MTPRLQHGSDEYFVVVFIVFHLSELPRIKFTLLIHQDVLSHSQILEVFRLWAWCQGSGFIVKIMLFSVSCKDKSVLLSLLLLSLLHLFCHGTCARAHTPSDVDGWGPDDASASFHPRNTLSWWNVYLLPSRSLTAFVGFFRFFEICSKKVSPMTVEIDESRLWKGILFWIGCLLVG